MLLTLDVPPDMEPLLLQKAAERGQTLNECFLDLIEGQLNRDRQVEKDQAEAARSIPEREANRVEHA